MFVGDSHPRHFTDDNQMWPNNSSQEQNPQCV